MRTIHQQNTILHLAVLLPTDRNGIMGRCEHGKSMFANCGHCLWQEIGGEYPDEISSHMQGVRRDYHGAR